MKAMEVVERVECRATKILKRRKHPSSEEKLRELGGFPARRQSCAGEMSSISLNPGWEVSWFVPLWQLGAGSRSLSPATMG